MNNSSMKDDQKQELAKAIGDAINSAMMEAERRHSGLRLSQAELGRKCGLSQPTVNRTLKGKTIPETATLLAISKYFAGMGIALNQELAPLLQEVQRLESPPGPAYNATPTINMVVEIMRQLGAEAQQRLLGAAQLIHEDEKRQVRALQKERKLAGRDMANSQQSILASLSESLKTGTKSR